MAALSHQSPQPIDPPEDEPLLGSPGQAVERPARNIYHNLITGESYQLAEYNNIILTSIGTATVAQAGIWIVSDNLSLHHRSSFFMLTSTPASCRHLVGHIL